jgi:hypothetical protein
MISLLPRTRVNDQFSQHVVGDRRAAGADDVDIRGLQSQDPLEVREPRVHAGYDRDLGLRMPAQLRIVLLCELLIGLYGMIDKAHRRLPFEYLAKIRRRLPPYRD